VTVNADREVTVKFKQAKSFHVPAQYKTIADAIKAASDHGDKIVVSAGTYRTHSLDFGGKAITLASEHPDDPCSVARTIIDCAQLGRAFIFQSGEGPDSVIDGFTIKNGSAVANPTTPNNSGGQGANGDDAFGGAVACFNGSSPTLSNLVIQDCVAQGRTGRRDFVYPDSRPRGAGRPRWRTTAGSGSARPECTTRPECAGRSECRHAGPARRGRCGWHARRTGRQRRRRV
jgi:hypothetical protein